MNFSTVDIFLFELTYFSEKRQNYFMFKYIYIFLLCNLSLIKLTPRNSKLRSKY